MFRPLVRATAIAGVALLPACENMSREEGILAGAFFGYLTAQALEADHDWTIVAVLAGAAVGTLVARNTRTNRCAYAYGHDRYYTAACPR